MTAKELGEQMAFPLIDDGSVSTGMNLREYLAGLAMQGFTSNDGWAKTVNPDDWDEYAERLADASVKIADALLKELTKEK